MFAGRRGIEVPRVCTPAVVDVLTSPKRIASLGLADSALRIASLHRHHSFQVLLGSRWIARPCDNGCDGSRNIEFRRRVPEPPASRQNSWIPCETLHRRALCRWRKSCSRRGPPVNLRSSFLVLVSSSLVAAQIAACAGEEPTASSEADDPVAAACLVRRPCSR